MGGEITVRSSYGTGSCFSVAIPLRSVNHNVRWLGSDELRNEAAFEAKPERQAQLPALSGRVLLAEDSLDNQRVLVHYLRQIGLDVETVENGRLAIEKALASQFDLILMDIQMPELDGFCATSSLRRSGYEGPIIALTAHAMIEDREKCLRAGCTDYLTKPVEARSLVLALARHLRPQRTNLRPDRTRAAITAATGEYAIISRFHESCGMETLIRDYVESLPSKVESFRSLMAAGDVDDVRALAHQITGTGGMYGYPCLGETAALIEQAARERQDPELLAELVEEFSTLSSRIGAGLTDHTAAASR
jgi:CheY-like chemotaxis protein/HPt (histidine-containing phosphotransfer) domain-containing protein